jgi:hypothetical protein
VIRSILMLLLVLLATPFRSVMADSMEGGRSSCGLELTPEDLAAYQANLEAGLYEHDASRDLATYSVRLAFHVVRNTNGTGGIPQSQLDQAMIDLADGFAGMGICFFVVEQDTINNTTYYNIDSDAERSALKAINNNPNAIDCYFVNDDDGWCGMSSFTWSTDQGITFSNSCVGLATNPSTFPHEVGHYFDLLHTHETANGSECPNGSNCGTAGDGLCDTPADPGLGTDNVNSSCVYTGSETIFCSGATRSYNPDPDNIMSYSRKTCRTEFTANQRSRILATLTGGRWTECAWNAPDFDSPTPAGWSNSVVPRNTTGANSGSCLVTATLPGNSNSTYMNAATRQPTALAAFPFIHNRLYLDNVHVWNYNYGAGTNWSGTLHYNNFGPWNVRGGRHSVHSSLDWADEVCETNESDNLDYSQWVWSPYILSPGASVSRSAPPEKMTTTYTYPNCDGFTFVGSDWWTVIAAQPVSSTADFDVHLHEGYSGSTSGFGATLATSTYGSGSADWIIVNHNNAGSGGTYEAGIVNYDGESANVRVNRVDSRTVSQIEGTRVCGELAANQILDVFEFYISSSEIDKSWTMSLSSDQAADLDLYLYPKTLEFGDKGDYLDASLTDGTSSESITEVFAETGYYSLVVAKRDQADLGIACAYDVKFSVGAFRLSIYPPTAPQVALVQDSDPWGSTEWRDQLDAQSIAYTVIPTANLSSTDLGDYGVVIVPTPRFSSAWTNIQGALAQLDAFNEEGGVLVLGTGTNSSVADGASLFDGISQSWETCTVVHPTSHLLVTGVGADAPGSNAVHYVYNNLPVGWTTLATTDCGANRPVMAVNETLGALLFGAPMEHSELYYFCSLGESIENIVAWAWKRARQTVKGYGVPYGLSTVDQLVYRNGSLFGTISHSTSESLPWLTMNPTSGNLGGLGSVTTNWFFNPSGMTAGTHRGTATVTHDLYNTPETVYAVFTVGSRKPVAPLIVDFVPVDFEAGNAIMNLSYAPVTQDVNGNPVTVDYYLLYYDNELPMVDPAAANLGLSNNVNLHFHNVGMVERAFARLVAVDVDGVLVADSNPELALPDDSQVRRAPEGFVHPATVPAAESDLK